jgi:hypothetical protein
MKRESSYVTVNLYPKARESEKSQIRVYRSSVDCEMKESKISIELKEELSSVWYENFPILSRFMILENRVGREEIERKRDFRNLGKTPSEFLV